MNRFEIQANIENPKELERLYQANKSGFKKEFNLLYPELKDTQLAAFWNERLNFEGPEISWGSSKELTFVVIASIIAGCIAKLPDVLHINLDSFFQRNIGFIVLPILTFYFAWKNNLKPGRILAMTLAFVISLFFINLLPGNNKSDTWILACIHLPLFLWTILGMSFVGENLKSNHLRIDFLRFNGDLVVLSALMVIAGGVMTGITIGLFSVIGIKVEHFYQEYVIVFGLSAVPIVGTYVTRMNPQLVNKVSPVIAKIFSPLVLITLVVYLVAIFFSGKDPYNDRDFLMIFNFLLIGVMAIILFAVAESSKKESNQSGNIILLALSVVTSIVNGIALSAILFRISEWGITPNRLAVLGANILMLINLLMVTYRLYQNRSKKSGMTEVENAIARFLPVYGIWTVIVTFIFPLIFQFK